ncbi:hypothetical protein B0H14DRAFT_3495362 [Mycena olivaceomarginata]|nr:hypothetical protein B0H14DRAFT_3495362 [Mycena olivaceomarginata]
MTSNDWVMDSHLGLGGDPTGFDNDFLAPGGDPTEFDNDDHSSHPKDGWSNYMISSTASGGRSSNEVSLQLSPASIEPIGQWFEESATIYNGPEEAQQAPIVPAAPRTSNSTPPVAPPRPRSLFLARVSAPSPGAAAAEGLSPLSSLSSTHSLLRQPSAVQRAQQARRRPLPLASTPARSLDIVADNADKRIELSKLDPKPAHSSVGVTTNERVGLGRLDTEPCRWPPPPARSLDVVADKRVELTKVDAKPAHSSVGVTTNEGVDNIIVKLSRSSPAPLSLDIAAGECKELNVKLTLSSVGVTADEQAELVARSTPTAARNESAATAT